MDDITEQSGWVKYCINSINPLTSNTINPLKILGISKATTKLISIKTCYIKKRKKIM